MVLGALVGADVFVRRAAADEVERQVALRTEGAVGVQASVGRPGMLASMLVAGNVGPVHLHLDRFETQQVPILDLDADFRGVTVDRAGVFSGDVRIIHIDSVDLRFGLDGAGLSELAGVPVEVRDGQVRATIEGAAVDVQAHLNDRTLVLTAPVGRVSVELPESELLPCAAGLTVEASQIRIACTARPVPDELVRRLNGG